MAAGTETPKTAQETNSEPFVGLYTMFYRNSSNGNSIQTKNFRHHGDLKSARDRAVKHLQIISGGKVMFVQPLISDLQREEDFACGKTTQAELERRAAINLSAMKAVEGPKT